MYGEEKIIMLNKYPYVFLFQDKIFQVVVIYQNISEDIYCYYNVFKKANDLCRLMNCTKLTTDDRVSLNEIKVKSVVFEEL